METRSAGDTVISRRRGHARAGGQSACAVGQGNSHGNVQLQEMVEHCVLSSGSVVALHLDIYSFTCMVFFRSDDDQSDP